MEQSGDKSTSQTTDWPVWWGFMRRLWWQNGSRCCRKNQIVIGILLASDGKTGFTISPADKQDTGTAITLFLKSDAKEFLEEERISHLIKKYSDHILFPFNGWIKMASQNVSTRQRRCGQSRQKIFQKMTTRRSIIASAPAMIRHLPRFITRLKALSNSPIFYLFRLWPFDLYDPDRKSKIQLYVNRVFITDQCDELVPKWMRFLRGVIDTPDVNLNVSREMLQHSPVITKSANHSSNGFVRAKEIY